MSAQTTTHGYLGPHLGSYILYEDGIITEQGICNFLVYFFMTELLTEGVHNVTLVVIDAYGNRAQDTVMVTISAGVGPSVSGPSSLSYEEGSLGNWINWTCSDQNPSTFTVKRDGHFIISGSWDGSSIGINVDFLPEGIYAYSLVLTDLGGNEATHSVIVTVTPSAVTTTPTTNVTTTELTEIIQQLQGPLWTGIIIVGALAGLSIIVSVLFVRKLAAGTVKAD